MEFKSTSGLKKALSNSRIFGDISNELLADIIAVVEIKTVLGGSFIFKQNDASDSMLVLISGRLVARLTLPDGTSKTLSHISPGASAGELGLVLNQSRAASVIAVRDSCVAMLCKNDFDSLLRKYPIEMNRAITRTVYQYNTAIHRPAKHVSAIVITVVNVDDSIHYSALVDTVAKQVKLFGNVLHVKEDFIRSESQPSAWGGFIHEAEENYDFILLETSNKDSAWSRLVSRQADQILFVASSRRQKNSETINPCFLDGNMASEIRKSLVFIHPHDTDIPNFDDSFKKQAGTCDVYPIRAENNEDISRLCRFITDNAIGVVLGGGGARGLAHIGVLKALEDNGIPVDIVCGNSMGALLGAQYAIGVSTKVLVSNIQKFVASGDLPTLPMHSLLSGKKIEKNIKAMFKGHRLEAMWRPFFCVSCNLTKADVYVHEKGEMWKAVLASNSPAGILPPVIQEGQLLVDAALLDNVPVEALRKRLQFGTVIAVDVDVNEDLFVDPSIQSFNLKKSIGSWVLNHGEKCLPGIMDILNRAGHLGGLARRRQAIDLADYYFQPPVSDFSLMAYRRGNEIADKAYLYAIEKIKMWGLDSIGKFESVIVK